MKPTLARILTAIFVGLGISSGAQVTSYYDLEVDVSSVSSAYNPAGGNFVHLRSKRGTEGMNKTPEADAIVTERVREIVLVFTEENEEDEMEREEANMERWDNLIFTYPQFFQEGTVYRSVCQCNYSGDQEAFKKNQGFYVYYGSDKPVARTEPVKAAEPPAVKNETPAKKEETAKPGPPAPVKKDEPVAKKEKETKTEPPAKKEEPVAVNPPAEEPPAPVENAVTEEPDAPAAETKPAPRKKPATSKPRRAKDPKACRPPCYEGGDEDLYNFFAQNITFTKKQRRKAKNLQAMVRIQLNPDGSVKKAMVTGENASFNEQVQTAINGMNPWNAAVKNGVAVRSEVRFTLKYDKSTKAMRPAQMIMNPKPTPKCRCVSDAEIFGD